MPSPAYTPDRMASRLCTHPVGAGLYTDLLDVPLTFRINHRTAP